MIEDDPDSLDKTQPAIFSAGHRNPAREQTNDYDGIKQSHPYPFLNPAENTDVLGVIDHYEITRLLGEGGMGFVFSAEDLQLHRTVALKVMKALAEGQETARERFLQEARAMAAINSDHVVIVHQVGVQNDTPYLAMEFLKGQSMTDWLRENRRAPLDLILKWGIEIAEGLAAAHELKLVHRDIKPANLWIEAPDRRIKILDFGLTYAADSSNHHTRTGALVGTLEYMAPELFENVKSSPASDLFSLGCVLYQLASSRSPFAADSQISIIKKIATDIPKPLQSLRADIPFALSQLIGQLLSKQPEERPASAKEVGARLCRIREQWLVDGPAGSQTEAAAESKAPLRAATATSPEQGRSGNWMLRLVAIAIVVGGFFTFYPPGNQRTETAENAVRTAAESGQPLPDKAIDQQLTVSQPAPSVDAAPREESGFNNAGFASEEELAELAGDAGEDESASETQAMPNQFAPRTAIHRPFPPGAGMGPGVGRQPGAGFQPPGHPPPPGARGVFMPPPPRDQ